MKLSDYIVQFLKDINVTAVFGFQGGAIIHFIDSICKSGSVKFVSTHHEQAAAFAAEGYARVTGNIGVAAATSGPGAANLVTGIGSAFFDSIPCLYITGQVNTYEYKRSPEIRQEGFQETDIVSIVKPITKYAVMVNEPEKIKYYLEKAVHTAKSGRPGPVLLDIPMDVQRAEINPDSLQGFYECDEYKRETKFQVNINDIKTAAELIKGSKRPLILAGGGIRLADACTELGRLVEITGIPVASTLMGIDCFDHNDSHYVGFLGAYGNRYSNLAAANCDLLMVLGSRLTSRQTSTLTDSFARGARIVHVDIDKNELGIKVKEHLSIECDVKYFIQSLNETLICSEYKFDYSAWMDKINSYKKSYPSYPTQKSLSKPDPNEFMHRLSDFLPDDSIICLDIGQNQIWASQSLKIRKNQRLINAGGMGAMGFGLSSAIGAFFARPRSKILVICGDGGFQMNMQELQTIVRERLPIKIIIMNNKTLGMIRHFQEMYLDSRYYGTIEGYSVPDFMKISEAYGIESLKINDERRLDDLKERLLDDKTYILEVELNNITYVIPKLAMGRPIEDQDPLLDRKELENNMIIDLYNKV